MKKYLKWIGQILTILSLVFIGRTIWKMGLDFSTITNIPVFIVVLIIGILAKTATVFVSAYVWSSWVFFFAGQKGNRKEGIRIYTKANTGKYLPGNVMHYVERNLFADKMGVSQKKVAASTIIEVLSLIFVSFFVSLIFSHSVLLTSLEAVKNLLGQYFSLIAVLVIAGGVLCCVAVVILLRKKILNVLKDYQLRDFLVQLLIGMVGQAIVLIVLGLIFVLLYVYMGGKVTLNDTLVIVAGYMVSWVLGFVVPGAPGGVGIREMVLTLIVGPVVGPQLVVSLALIHRLITVIGDFLAYVIGAVV